MATNNINVDSAVDSSGNSYTNSISNDELTNDDFLQLMLQELKLQDPTKPVDSKQMLSTQMQMSTINTNLETINAMKSLQTSFSQTALSNASAIIGRNIEDGNINDAGINKAYKVSSVETVDGVVQVKANELLYIHESIVIKNEDDTYREVPYAYDGTILDENGEPTGQRLALNSPGQPIIKDGKLEIFDSENNQVTDHKYELGNSQNFVYSNELSSIPFSQITKIF